MIGDTATIGAAQSRSAARIPGTARIGSMLIKGLDGQMTTARALDMRREIAVAEAEPGLAAQGFERRHKGPGLAAAPPAEFGVVVARERVEQRIEIRRDLKPEMHEIIARIGDDGQRVRRQD